MTTQGGLALVAALVALAGCGGGDTPAAPASDRVVDDPRTVLTDYLGALERGDCATTRSFEGDDLAEKRGDLCGRMDVSGVEVHESMPIALPGYAAGNAVQFGAELTTTGGEREAFVDGRHPLFFTLAREAPDRPWLVVGLGTGP